MPRKISDTPRILIDVDRGERDTFLDLKRRLWASTNREGLVVLMRAAEALRDDMGSWEAVAERLEKLNVVPEEQS